MDTLRVLLANLSRMSRGRLIWRSLLAAPFVLSFVLTLVLGPGTINSVHGSFTWLAVLSLAAALFMLSVSEGLLIPVGLVTFLVFPLMAGLGFNFAPNWARPIVAIIFYGSMLACAAAVLTRIGHVLRPVVRNRPEVMALGAAGVGLIALVAVVVSITSTPSSLTRPPLLGSADPVNIGVSISTGQREAEPSFTTDGRTMVFNCHNADICVTHLSGTWDEGRWSSPQLLGSPISTAYTEVEPWINAAGDKLYFNSTRPFARGESFPGLSLYVDAVGLVSRVGVSLFGGLGEDDIWVSNLIDGAWSEPRNLNDVAGEPPINTSFFDHCLSFSSDGNEAFWTSTRPGGFGGNDIWTSRRVDGKWTQPENLGPNVNGPGSEHHSIPTPDGRSLYITRP